MMSYELLKPDETVDTKRYRQQIINLNKVILLHDNVSLLLVKTIQETIEALS